MSIIQSRSVNGQTRGFVPEVPASEPVVNVPEQKTIEPNWSEVFLEASGHLSANQLSLLLEQQFADELNALKQQQEERGYQEGLASGRKEAEKERVESQQEIEELKLQWTTLLTQARKSVTIEIYEPDTLLVLLSQALLKLIDVELTDEKYAFNLLNRLAREYAEHQDMEVRLPEVYVKSLRRNPELLEALPGYIRIQHCENMQPRDYALTVAGGQIEVSLDDMLQQFKQQCLLFSRKESE